VRCGLYFVAAECVMVDVGIHSGRLFFRSYYISFLPSIIHTYFARVGAALCSQRSDDPGARHGVHD